MFWFSLLVNEITVMVVARTDEALLEVAQLIFLIFHTLVCKFGWVDKRLDSIRGKNISRQMYGKLKKISLVIYRKLHPSNLVNTIFYLVL